MEDGSLGTLQQRAAELEHMAEVLLTGEQLRKRADDGKYWLIQIRTAGYLVGSGGRGHTNMNSRREGKGCRPRWKRSLSSTKSLEP
ncbi:UNVERIFIED_CONTAM: hypothetical protein K2H54_021600 [Gekko kuhli]